jgi:hypothetical protein
MTTKSFLDCERKSLDKLKKYQLPNVYKKVGIVILAIGFIALFFTDKDTNYKLIAKYTLLIGFLIVSISKEKIEDELVENLRMHSYTFAFIFAVFITITNPLFSYIVNFFTNEKQAVFDGIGDWMILWLLLSVQVFYFEYAKKLYR